MSNLSNIRWKQRFQNYTKSFGYLEDAINIENPDVIQRAGLIQFFEMSFELAWKVMKDYLENKGFADVNSPRDSIKKAFELELIVEGEIWLEALVDRNLTCHTYEEKTAKNVERLIRDKCFLILKSFKIKLSEEV